MFLFISLIELIYTPCLLKRNKYLSKSQNNYSSKLSKVAVMSLAIFPVFISTFQQVLRVEKLVILNLAIFTNDESERYR